LNFRQLAILAEEIMSMPVNSIVAGIVAVAISLVAATYRFGDSGHAVGALGLNGGKARHAMRLDPGKQQYVLAVTGTVLPPYRGDARVELEGVPPMDYEVHLSSPVVNLGMHRGPHFANGILEGLQPKDKFALWIVMRPANPQQFAEMGAEGSKHAVVFTDTETGKSLLRVPVIYHEEEEMCHDD
jgi:hypothetical protein